LSPVHFVHRAVQWDFLSTPGSVNWGERFFGFYSWEPEVWLRGPFTFWVKPQVGGPEQR